MTSDEVIIALNENYKKVSCTVGPRVYKKYKVERGDLVHTKEGPALVDGVNKTGDLLVQLLEGGSHLAITTEPHLVKISPPIEESTAQQTAEETTKDIANFSLGGAKILNDKSLSDVEIHVADQILYAHRIILSIRCDKFKAMFNYKCNEAITGVIKVESTDPVAYLALLKYIYKDRVSFGKLMTSSLLNLGDLAHEYLLQSLAADCCEHLISRLKVENILSIYMYMRLHERQYESLQCLDYINKHCSEIGDALCSLTQKDLVEVIQYQSAVANRIKYCIRTDTKTRDYFVLFGMHWGSYLDEDGLNIFVEDICEADMVVFEVYSVGSDGTRMVYLLQSTGGNASWTLKLLDEDTSGMMYIEKLKNLPVLCE